MKHYSKYINPYIKLIKENKVEHCKEQELMIDNIVIPVLNRDDVYIDERKIEECLSLQKYFPYELIEWEIFCVALIVGVFHKAPNGYIDVFFKDIRIIVGRGSGKNGLISFLCFYFISPYHGVRGYNIDLLANSETQAKTSFKDVYDVIKDNHDKSNEKALKSNFKATKEEILGIKTKSILRFNTSSTRGKDSKRTGCAIYDEKHEYVDSTNINTLRSGLGKMPFGREITITTNGHVRGGVFDKEADENIAILKEYNPLNRTLVFWCRIEHEDEWDKLDKLVKAIPSLNDFHHLRTEIQLEIQKMPYNMDYFPEYMAKRCNFPIGNKDVEVASWENIKACNKELIDLSGCDCVGGVDYAKTDDFVGCCLLFKRGGRYYLIHHTFVCMKSRDLQGIKAPLKEWEEMGHLTFVEDVEISPKTIANWFKQMKEKYNILKIGVDNYRYSLLNSAFKEIGFDAYESKNIVLVRPSNIMITSPIINSVFVNQNLSWGIAPIMNWMTNNTKKILSNGNITYGKIEENYRKTDTFMATVNAFSLWEEIENEVTEVFFAETLTF